MSLKKIMEDKYILCVCEGNAEIEIINILLDNRLLIFDREDLIENKVHRRISVKKIQENFLGLSYEKDLVILRIIDSKNERFVLDKAYKGRFKIITVITSPEIEILIIIDKGDYDEFCKSKSNEKPSQFCKRYYDYKKIKSKGFMSDYFKESKKLIDSIYKYSKQTNKKATTLYSLIKDTK